MLLKKVTIFKYKSFFSEQTFPVGEGLTRVIGKNESGKSALLEALAKSNYFEINPEFSFDKTRDYPRGQLALLGTTSPDAVTCEYSITKDVLAAIEEDLGEGVLKRNTVAITTLYDNSSDVSGIEVDFEKFKAHMVKKVNVGQNVARELKDIHSFEDLLDKADNSTSYEDIKAYLQHILIAIEAISSVWSNLLNKYIYFTYLKPALPKYWYFSDYYLLPARINLTSYANGNLDGSLSPREYEIVKALFELSGLDATGIQSENDFERFITALETTSNKITDDMAKYWSTNENLEIRFDIEHSDNNTRWLNIRVYSPRYRVTLPLESRSRGFVWFFSFMVWFSKIQTHLDSRFILLLDEPGFSLHGLAQRDLLRFIKEELVPNHQVIFTTHSPYMIDPDKLNEILSVIDTNDRNVGSVIHTIREESDADTLVPVQLALGHELVKNVLPQGKTLVVRGLSDMVLLRYLSSLLKAKNKTGLPSDLTIIPVDRLDQLIALMLLNRDTQSQCVCLYENSGKELPDEAKSLLLGKKIMFYKGSKKEKTIEDLLMKEEYLKAYEGAFKRKIRRNSIDAEAPVVPQVQKSDEDFDRYAPIVWLITNSATEPLSEETLDRFEKLFIKLLDLYS
ncbi:MAG: ATP-binding protein [Erysipelotrichaceae bacterium]|jgi:predicted ATP-dependent endonuclease of OLD family|nr:ATP-binding protein [Erysipelotrichaceae bacterium]